MVILTTAYVCYLSSACMCVCVCVGDVARGNQNCFLLCKTALNVGVGYYYRMWFNSLLLIYSHRCHSNQWIIHKITTLTLSFSLCANMYNFCFLDRARFCDIMLSKRLLISIINNLIVLLSLSYIPLFNITVWCVR